MTTRKTLACLLAVAALTALVFGLGGCATPGPLHIYTTGSAPAAPIRDSGGHASAAEFPSFLAEGETLIGFAYDPFTDHFFLRLAPGDRLRVVDRPARAVKREFTVAALATTAPNGDLAIRPRDGHVFAAHPSEPAVIEFNRFGELIRTLPLASLTAPPAGLAYDPTRDHLLVLSGGEHARVTTHTRDGQRVASVALDREVSLTGLAYDPEQRELYALLARERGVGIFNEQGHFLRTLPLASASATSFLDVGPRSFLRLF